MAEPKSTTRKPRAKKATNLVGLPTMVDASLTLEKMRVALQVRLAHLKKNHRTDRESEELLQRVQNIEGFADGRVSKMILLHPAFGWFNQVKGIGKENIGKVVGLVRVKPSDEIYCPNHECRLVWPKDKELSENHKEFCSCKTELKEYGYANTISGFWKFAGYDVTSDNKGPKKVKGSKLTFNSQLRSMCWRVANSLLRAKGPYYRYYLNEKEKDLMKYANQGISIVPAEQLPKIDGKKQETEKIVSEGHVHNRALRKMIKLFLSHLWLEWRKGEGLPVTDPYPIGVLGHDSMIKPEDMTGD